MATALSEATFRATNANGSDEQGGDAELLTAFLESEGTESEAAFQSLVERHGPMVLGVCRNILDQIHDAEDAFQATFLILAKQAGSLRNRRSLACWLYEVAYRVALRARTRSDRRRSQELEAAEMLAATPRSDNDTSWNELRPVLHEEVNQLPEKYRSAVVLCYLEGRTNEEAAELLNWPVGTVKGRLSRARDLLRSRLTRRGLAFSAAFLVSSLSRNTVFADCVPARLVEDTAGKATALVHGSTATSIGLSSNVAAMIVEDLAAAAINKTLLTKYLTIAATTLALLVALMVGLARSARMALPPGGTDILIPAALDTRAKPLAESTPVHSCRLNAE